MSFVLNVLATRDFTKILSTHSIVVTYYCCCHDAVCKTDSTTDPAIFAMHRCL